MHTLYYGSHPFLIRAEAIEQVYHDIKQHLGVKDVKSDKIK